MKYIYHCIMPTSHPEDSVRCKICFGKIMHSDNMLHRDHADISLSTYFHGTDSTQ